MADLSHLVDTSRAPGYEYGNILPFRKPTSGGPAEWNAGYSGLVKSIADALAAPGQALSGQEQSPESAVNFAMNLTGGGGTFGTVPAGGLGMAARGMKRVPPLWHGTPSGNFDDILQQGLLQGKSAELNIPGSSLSRDPKVSTGFAQFDPFVGPVPGIDDLTGSMFQAKLKVPKEEIYNLRPSEYVSGVVPEAPAYNKPNKFFGEKETFVPRKANQDVNSELQQFIMDSLNPDEIPPTLTKIVELLQGSKMNPLVYADSFDSFAQQQPVDSLVRQLSPKVAATAKENLKIPVDVSPITDKQANAIALELFQSTKAHRDVIAAKHFASRGPGEYSAALDGIKSSSSGPIKDIIMKLDDLSSYQQLSRGIDPAGYLAATYQRSGAKVHPFWQGVMNSPEKMGEVNVLRAQRDKLINAEQHIQELSNAVRYSGGKTDAEIKTASQELDKAVRAFPAMRDKLDAQLRRFLSTPHKAGTKIGDKSVPADLLPEPEAATAGFQPDDNFGGLY